MKDKSQNGTVIVKNYADLNLIDANKTTYGIVSHFFPKNDTVVIFFRKKLFSRFCFIPLF